MNRVFSNIVLDIDENIYDSYLNLDSLSKKKFLRYIETIYHIDIVLNIKRKINKSLPQEILDKIFGYCDWKTIENGRFFQSDFFKRKTQFNDINKAAVHGNLLNIKYLRDIGYEWKNNTFIEDVLCQSTFECAAINGNLENMKWLKENGCKLDRYAFSGAAKNGNIENMEWLKDNGCPFDYWSFVQAAKVGNLEIMKWLKDNGCPNDSEFPFECAAMYGKLESMKWLKENGYRVSHCALDHVFKSKNDKAIEWVYKNVRNSFHILRKDDRILPFLRKHGCCTFINKRTGEICGKYRCSSSYHKARQE